MGLIQVTTGAGYLYHITNEGSAVGIFANRNHNGLFLAIAIAMLVPVLAYPFADRHLGKIAPWLATILAAGFWFSAITTDSRSSAFLASLAFALFVANILVFSNFGRSSADASKGVDLVVGLGRRKVLVVYGGLLLLGLFVGCIAFLVLGSLMQEGFNRADVYPLLAKGIREYWLFGSGMGSFEWAVRPYEIRDEINFAYWNHAHNDVAQIVMEAGLFGVLGLALGGWWLVAGVRAYSARVKAFKTRDLVVEAAFLVFVLVAVQSFVDYPLRTSTISIIFFVLVGVVEARVGRNPV